MSLLPEAGTMPLFGGWELVHKFLGNADFFLTGEILQ